MAGTFFFNVVVLVTLWSITVVAFKNGTGPTRTTTTTATGLPVQTSTVLPSIRTTSTSSVTVTPSSYSTQASVVPTSHNGTTPPQTTGSQTKSSAITASATVTLSPSPCANCTTPKPSGHRNHSMKPGGHGDSRGKWVATGFAIFFSITTIVMTVLYCRQRKIYRELEGDSSLSRLI
ncbi:PREDICTED: cell wall integrity and stress response component 4-like [Acropora digitifera]|uniref:cell wall integrity and stress response component 4-like n=1 Tax=Acropora digitifera TaxID=70779 RepID=UPI00077AEEB0|nr:PREDICTED: cell wall integrity and stress response component 4-like [Acropora digitifera]